MGKRTGRDLASELLSIFDVDANAAHVRHKEVDAGVDEKGHKKTARIRDDLSKADALADWLHDAGLAEKEKPRSSGKEGA